MVLLKNISFLGYEDMKKKLVNHLKRLADEGRDISENDINEFFSELISQRKRRRIDSGNVDDGANNNNDNEGGEKSI